MTVPTPPVVSEAMREAVALIKEDIENRIACLFNRQPHMSGRQINRLHGGQRRDVEDLASDIASEIARLTAHAECGHANADENYRRLQAAEAGTARVRAEVADALTQGRREGLEEAAILVEACALGSNETVIAICDIIADRLRKVLATAPAETQKPEQLDSGGK